MPRPCIETRQDLVTAIRERYQGGTKDEKLRILDEFVAITGYHRKHAIRLFKAGSTAPGASRRSRLPVYDAAVREALVVLWEASDRVCGKRLRPLLPILVSALERHGHLTLASTVRARVLAASAATLDRLLRPIRAAVSGRRAPGGLSPPCDGTCPCAAEQINLPLLTRDKMTDSTSQCKGRFRLTDASYGEQMGEGSGSMPPHGARSGPFDHICARDVVASGSGISCTLKEGTGHGTRNYGA